VEEHTFSERGDTGVTLNEGTKFLHVIFILLVGSTFGNRQKIEDSAIYHGKMQFY
jgi:hypothetical protein